MKHVEWIEINGKRVLPVSSRGAQCSTSWEPAATVKAPDIVCYFFGDCPNMPCRGFGRASMFINEEQLPDYLALKLQGLAP